MAEYWVAGNVQIIRTIGSEQSGSHFLLPSDLIPDARLGFAVNADQGIPETAIGDVYSATSRILPAALQVDIEINSCLF
jgi:hypothetical protein